MKKCFCLIITMLLAAVLSIGCAHRSKNTDVSISSAETDVEMNVEDIDELGMFDDEFEEETVYISDPLIAWNRLMYHVSDRIYLYLLIPIAEGYEGVVPEMFRSGIKNFFHNLAMPVRLVNCVLQGKLDAAGSEIGRFFLNSTVGVLGFGNPARNYPDMNPENEDMGQTLGTYGIGNGFYIYWPVFGPSTLRDSVGMVGDWFLRPLNYVEPRKVSTGLGLLNRVNTVSFQTEEYKTVKEAAFEPYIAIRDGYITIRKNMIDK